MHRPARVGGPSTCPTRGTRLTTNVAAYTRYITVGPTGIVYVTDDTDGTLYVAGGAPTVLCEVAIDRRSHGAETPAKKTAAKR